MSVVSQQCIPLLLPDLPALGVSPARAAWVFLSWALWQACWSPVLLISKPCLVCRLTVHWLAGPGQEAADRRTQERHCPEATVGSGDLKAAYQLVAGSVHPVSCLT